MRVSVFTASSEIFNKVRSIIPKAVAEVQHVVQADSDFIPGTSLALVDGKWGGSESELHRLVEKLAANAIYTVLVDDEAHIQDSVPELLAQGLVDDLLLTPIRPIELLGKLKHVEHLMKVNELISVNSDVKTLIEKFEEDIRSARAIQRSLIPEKFPSVHGFKVSHKYLSGLKSGGDYLDFFEFEDKTHVGILMSDSSGYGLSSAFMSVILRLTLKLSKDQARSPSATVAAIFEELQLAMKPKENLSIFYGVLNRKTFELSYVSGGNIRFVRQDESRFEEHVGEAEPLAKGQHFVLKDQKISLNPGERLVIMSDGFCETFENKKLLEAGLSKNYGEDGIALINDLCFRVKKTLESEDDMPAQDCSVMIIDIEKRAMRLAK